MSFVQVVEFRTSDLDAVRQADEGWRRASEGKRTVRREILAADRNQPGRYFAIVFFDSYESAMENSKLPVTAEFSQRTMALGDGPPTFYNLDVIEDVG